MLECQNLTLTVGQQVILQDLSLRLEAGEAMGLCGGSGRGKTTLGRAMAGLHGAAKGRVLLDGQNLPRIGASAVQYLCQSPVFAMNPRWRIGQIIAEAGPLAPDLAASLCLAPEWMQRFPHEMSGGQLQRIALARALCARPRFLIADEITAALDPLSQQEIWRCLAELRCSQGLGLLVISHDQALLKAVTTKPSLWL